MKCKHVWPTHWSEWEGAGDYKICTKCGHQKWAAWVIKWQKQRILEATTCMHKCPIHCKK